MPVASEISVKLTLDKDDFEHDIDRMIAKLERIAELAKEIRDACS